MYLSDMSIVGPMITPDYQATPDVWDWDAMPDPTIDELAAVTGDDLDIIVIDAIVFGDLY